MKDKEQKQQVLVETEYEVKTGNRGAGKLEAPCREYLKAKGEMAPLNKEVKKLQTAKKTAEKYLLKELPEGNEVEYDGYVFKHNAATKTGTSKNEIDVEGLLEFITERKPELIERFTKNEIVYKETPAKLSVKKVGK